MAVGEIRMLSEPKLDLMILYKKRFPLSKEATFSRYLKALDEMDFLPYIVHVEKGYHPTSCRLDIIFVPMVTSTFPFIQLWVKPFSNWFILNQCIVEYSKSKREITLKASVGLESLFLYLLFFGVLIVAIISSIATHVALLSFIFIILFLALLAPMYNRDVRRLEKIGAIAMKSINKGK
jgi:hypothetical protein